MMDVPSPTRLDLAALMDMAKDPDVPDAEVARFLTGDPSRTGAFAPAVVADPDRVEIPPGQDLAVRGTTGMRVFNGLARWRRRVRFERARGDGRPVLLAEGDSWFQFPFLLDDVVDHLGDTAKRRGSFRIRCFSEAGDVLARMVFAADPEYLEGLAELAQEPGLRALIFSAGGNDFLGEDPDAPAGDPDGGSILARMVRPFEAGRPPAWHIDTAEFRMRLDALQQGFAALLREVAHARPGLRVVLHGYDYAFPSGFPGDQRKKVSWAARDQWIAGPLARLRGITDPQLQRGIVVALVDHLNDMLRGLCGGTGAGGQFAHGFHADLRGTLATPADFADELHPTDAAAARVAAGIARWV